MKMRGESFRVVIVGTKNLRQLCSWRNREKASEWITVDERLISWRKGKG